MIEGGGKKHSKWWKWVCGKCSHLVLKSTIHRRDLNNKSHFKPLQLLKVGTHYATCAATGHSDKSLCVYRSADKLLQKVAWHIGGTNCFVWTGEFCRRSKLHQFSLTWFCATCCSDKILLLRQQFPHNFSRTHDMLLQCVARVGCCNLSLSEFRPLLLCCSISIYYIHTVMLWRKFSYTNEL